MAALAAIAHCLAMGAPAGCTRGHRASPADGARDFGAIEAPLPNAVESLGYLAMARAVLEANERAAAPPRQAPGRRVLVAFWAPGSPTVVASASGPTLADSVARAAEALRPKVPQPQSGRIEIDVPTRFESVALDELGEAPLAAIGFEGVLVTRDDGQAGFVLPGEIAQRQLFRLGSAATFDSPRIASLVAARAGVSETEARSMRAYRFRADAHVESPQHDRALTLVRGMVERPAEVTPEQLLAAARKGADYLSRMLDGAGRYVYLYHAADDRDDPSYGWLRHAGTTYALFEAFEEFGTPAYLQKGELALSSLSARLTDHPASQGKYLLDTNDEEEQGVGGGGLALLAFAKHAAITGTRVDLETMRALARYIIKRQYDDGHFRSNADVQHETGKTMKREPVYYTGEALLGLMRLFAIDPQSAYLEAARRGANWVIGVRDAHVSEEIQEHDHWMAYALNDLYRVTHDEAYAKHADKIARAIQKKQHGSADALAPDLVGSFYDGQSNPASTRLEAYDAEMVLVRFAGKSEEWLLAPAKQAARAILGQQFDAENDFWLKNPAKAEGGVRESPLVNDVRIDYVQHALSAWVHLARVLRDPVYGTRGVPSQDPVRPADVELSTEKGRTDLGATRPLGAR